MSLGQIGNTHPSLYAFLCEFDALKESFLPLIFLHDFSPNFGKCVFDSMITGSRTGAFKLPPSARFFARNENFQRCRCEDTAFFA